MTPNSPAMPIPKPAPKAYRRPSWLLSALFDRLNAAGTIYCVMNNYETMPEVIPTDVDITVAPAFFAKLDDFIANFARENDGFIAQKLWHGHEKCSYVVCVGGEGARSFLHLDFFTNSSVNWFPFLISHVDLVDGRRSYRNFFTPRPEIELVFIAVRRIFKGDWSPTHCTRLKELHSRIDHDDWLEPRYRWMGDIFALAFASNIPALTRRLPQDRKTLRRFAWQSLGLGGTLNFFVGQFRRCVFRLRFNTGTLAVVVSPSGLGRVRTDALKAELEQVFFRTDIRTQLADGGAGALRDRLHFKLLKASKAGIVIDLAAGSGALARAASQLARRGLVDRVIALDGAVASSPGLPQASTVANPSGIFEAMLMAQATKTAEALDEGMPGSASEHA